MGAPESLGLIFFSFLQKSLVITGFLLSTEEIFALDIGLHPCIMEIDLTVKYIILYIVNYNI